MTRAKKILAAAAVILWAGAFSNQGFALDHTDFQKLPAPVLQETFSAFKKIRLYYLKNQAGRFVEILPAEANSAEKPRQVTRFFLDLQTAKEYQSEIKKISGGKATLKKISMAKVLKAIDTRSQINSGPELIISENFKKDVSFHFLAEIKSGKLYALQIKNKNTVPVFVSMQSAENLAKIVSISAPAEKHAQVKTLSFSEFLIFLNAQKNEGLPVRIFSYTSRPQYTVKRPMTWGVGSSYLFGAVLVLFLFWAITRSAKKN